MKKSNIRARILIPILIVIFILLAGSIAGIYWSYQDHLEEHIQEPVATLDNLIALELTEDTELLKTSLALIKDDPCIQDAWLAKDREALLLCSQPLFEKNRSTNDITHFYFHKLDRVNFLRVHNPPYYGDIIDRHTMATAYQSHQISVGKELGLFGILTLRVVQPWYIQDELVGCTSSKVSDRS